MRQHYTESPLTPWIALAAVWALAACGLWVSKALPVSGLVATGLLLLSTVPLALFPLYLAVAAEMMAGSLASRLSIVFAAAYAWALPQTILTRSMFLVGPSPQSALNRFGSPALVGGAVVVMSLVVIGLYRLGYGRPETAGSDGDGDGNRMPNPGIEQTAQALESSERMTAAHAETR